jgi:hypothetical protein
VAKKGAAAGGAGGVYGAFGEASAEAMNSLTRTLSTGEGWRGVWWWAWSDVWVWVS